MIFRKDAKQTFTKITSFIIELWNDPFRHIDEISDSHAMQSKLISFERQFEEFVELLDNAQRYGPTQNGQTQYQARKEILAMTYTSLRPFLIAYLRFDLEDERVGLRVLGQGTDAFQATWAYASLHHFVDSDDVFFRDRVGRAKDALKYYNDHLHSLSELAL